MRTPVVTIVALLLVVTAGCAGPILGGPSEVTVENRDITTYRLTVYTVDEFHEELGFNVTTPEGERRLVKFTDLRLRDGYRNVTLVDDTEATKEQFSIEPNDSVTMTVEEWEQGDDMIYLLEKREETRNGGLVDVKLVRSGCENRENPPSVHMEIFPDHLEYLTTCN